MVIHCMHVPHAAMRTNRGENGAQFYYYFGVNPNKNVNLGHSNTELLMRHAARIHARDAVGVHTKRLSTTPQFLCLG